MDSRLSSALDFIRTHQGPDGGWGYGPGRSSLVEPTGLCALALDSGGDAAASGRALGFLKACQETSGAVGIDSRAADGSWMAYAALLAFHGLGAAEEEGRLKKWVLGFEDASSRFTKDEIAIISSRYRYDASIPGWSWTPRTTAWVEPTSLFIFALIRTGVPAAERRIRSGIDLILDRRVPSGGWNYGNPYSNSFELEANAMSTALALAALGAAGVPESRPAVGAGLRFLDRALAGEAGTASLTWALLALKSYPSGAKHVPGLKDRLGRLQAADGSFRSNLFETALAYLVLNDAPILAPAAKEGR